MSKLVSYSDQSLIEEKEKEFTEIVSVISKSCLMTNLHKVDQKSKFEQYFMKKV